MKKFLFIVSLLALLIVLPACPTPDVRTDENGRLNVSNLPDCVTSIKITILHPDGNLSRTARVSGNSARPIVFPASYFESSYQPGAIIIETFGCRKKFTNKEKLSLPLADTVLDVADSFQEVDLPN